MEKGSIFISIIILGIVSSCMHKPDLVQCVAGTGGTLSIVVYASHGNTSITNYRTHLDTAFVKFGTLISPGTKQVDYDTFYIGEPGEDHIHCYGLKCGNYYIYRTAWDSVANVSRYGGFGVNITDIEGGKSVIAAVN
jgi:hypothetical protein